MATKVIRGREIILYETLPEEAMEGRCQYGNGSESHDD